MTRGRWISYSTAEMTWLEAHRLLPIGEYHAAFREAFGREDVSAMHLHSLRTRKGWKTGRTGQFEPGQAPANKGKRCAEGTGGRHPNARATQFKKGERTGVAVHLYKPIGTERLSKDGYLERKIHDGMPLQSRWRAVHLIEWEALHGPLPAGCCLKCVDTNKLNTDPSNWELIPKAIVPRLNGGPHKTKLAYDQVAPELRPVVLATAKLEHRARELRRKAVGK